MDKRRLMGALAAVALATVACTGGQSAAPSAGSPAASASGPAPSDAASPSASSELPTEVGEGEGALNLIAWAFYVEDGSTDPAYDWVTPFEEETGCEVNVTFGATSDEMVSLMRTGQHDGVSASGDATLRLIEAGDVVPVNLELVPNYADVFEGLKGQAHNTVDGQSYGVPHGRGANLLMYNTEAGPAPDSWSVVWDAASPYKGAVTAYDSPIYIADAAVYLMATRPELGITDPYSLDETQFAEAIKLLETQKTIIGQYWSDFNKHVQDFTDGTSKAGTTWQAAYNAIKTADADAPVDVTLPKEGSTGWSDTWMLSSQAEHPNCMYMWMNHIISPEVNAAATVFFGEAAISDAACAEAEKLSPGHCETFHANDESYFENVHYWNTATKECIDGRGPVCMDYSEWTSAWTQLRGAN